MPRIAVHFHLYYFEQLEDILRRLSCLNDCDYNLFVTMSEKNQQAQEKILQFNPDTTIWQTQNSGYDVGPFIDFLHKIKLEDYDFVLKIHTKRICNDYCKFKRRRFTIKTWRNILLDGLLSSPQAVENNLHIMEKNPEIGMIGSDYILVDINELLPPVQTLTAEMKNIDLDMPEDLHFVAGTMFLVRAKLLRPFLKYQITDFACSDKNIHDNTLAHILERLFGFAVTAQGYKIQGVKNKSYELQILTDALKRFLFQKKINKKGKLIVKLCRIPVFAKKMQKIRRCRDNSDI